MKIGIVGPAERAVAWEKNLRPHHSVKEVIIAPRLQDLGSVTACLILDESDKQLDILLQAIQKGLHSFLVSKLPTGLPSVEKIYHAAEEANVLLQFSHWPTLAPASQWMSKKIAKPKFIQIIREVSHTQFLEMKFNMEDFLIDELAYCLKWIDGAVHHIDLKTVRLQSESMHALHLFLRFDSGASANIYINSCSQENTHKRLASDHTYLLDCNVLSQTVRLGQENADGHLFFEKQSFDASKAAELSATHFLKSIQMKKPPLYSGYDLRKLASEIDKIKKRIGWT